MKKKINVVIAGIQGYVGKSLANLVMVHPYLNLAAVVERKSADMLYQEVPMLAEHQVPVFLIDKIDEKAFSFDILLLATPSEVSMKLVAKLSKHKGKIIDLSGAFRLPEEEFVEWYGMPHTAAHLLQKSCYALSPWWTKDSNQLQQDVLLANPGCYATCALMSLIPLLKENVIQTAPIIIDAKSGVSGAGKKVKQELMFGEVANNLFPYKVGKHQHIPEINNALAKFTKKICHVILTTYLLPIFQGISMTIYADAEKNFSNDEEVLCFIKKAYEKNYENYSLVQFGEIKNSEMPGEKFLLSIKNVVGTPKVHIAYYVNNKKVILFACIDNLLKGASSQAIENINTLYGFPIKTGLEGLL